MQHRTARRPLVPRTLLPQWKRMRLDARRGPYRRGAATLDYVLILGTLIPLCGICLSLGRRILLAVYEMHAVLIGSPFL